MRIQFATFLAFLTLVLPAVLTQTCYKASVLSAGSSQCQNPSIFTFVQMTEDPNCNQQKCVSMAVDGKEYGEQHQLYLSNEEDIPLPINHVRVKYYTDDQCTVEVGAKTTEYYAVGDWTNLAWFKASCNESGVHIQRYGDLERTKPTFDETYPLHSCTLSSLGFYVLASCSAVHSDCPISDTFFFSLIQP